MLFRKKLLIFAFILCLLLTIFAIFILPSHYTAPILMYHHIRQSGWQDRLSVPPANFKKQMDFLLKGKYQVISLEELINFIKSKKPLPHNLVVITFDDGYEDNYIYGFPILKNNNFPATIFLVTDSIDHKGYLSWVQAQEMINTKISIGSHSKTHSWLTELNDKNTLKEEILESKKFLEFKLKQPVKFFCYPSGAVNSLVKQEVINSGYLGACATHPGPRYSKYDIYALRRIKISNSDNLLGFWIKTSGYYTLFKSKK